MKWYLYPDAQEFSGYTVRAFKRYIKNISFPVVEPSKAIPLGDKILMPLEDNGPEVPENKVIDTRTIEVNDDNTASAVYTYRDMNSDELLAIHQSMSELVNIERDKRVVKGRSFTVTDYGDIPLTGREEDKVALMGLLIKAQGLKAAGVTVPILTIRDGENVNHTLTPDQMIELVSQGMAWIENVMTVSWNMKDKTGDFTNGIPEDYTNDIYWPE